MNQERMIGEYLQLVIGLKNFVGEATVLAVGLSRDLGVVATVHKSELGLVRG